MTGSSEREARAALRRKTTILNRTRLGRVERDLTPLSGPEALSLVERLTRESWTAAGKTFPRYRRDQVPVHFVPGHPK